MAVAEPGHDSGRDGDDVLERAGELDADHVVRAVEPERRAREAGLELAGVFAFSEATTAAVGSARATPSANVGPDSAASAAAGYRSRMISDIRWSVSGSIPLEVDTIRRPGRRRPETASSSGRIDAHGTETKTTSPKAKASARSDDGRTDGGSMKPAEPARVTPVRLDARRDLRVAAPEQRLVPAPRELDRERRSPGSGAEDRDFHFCPSRRSSPRARRSRFSRCFTTMRTAAAAAATTVQRGSWKSRPHDRRQQDHRDDRAERDVARHGHDRDEDADADQRRQAARARGTRRPPWRRPFLRGIRRRSERRARGSRRTPRPPRRAGRP